MIAVPESEVATCSPQAMKTCDKINVAMQTFAEENNGTVITVDDSLDDGECAWDDFRHYSKTMCGKVLDAIDSKYGNDDNLIRVGYNFITDRKYKRVQTT